MENLSKKVKQFIHLRNYTQYSLSDGALRISDLINFCKSNNSPAISISDKSNLFGCMEFSLNCVKNGVQPIISCSISVMIEDFAQGEILLIISDEIGYKSLSKILTESYLNSKNNFQPVVHINQLKKNKSGLICLSGGTEGLLRKNFEIYGIEKSQLIIKKLRCIYENNFFLEIQRLKKLEINSFINFLIESSLNKSIPLVATNENYFFSSDFYESLDVLSCISKQTYFDYDQRKKLSEEFFLKNTEKMYELFSDIPVALTNTLKIAKKCHFLLKEKLPRLPKIDSKIIEKDLLIEKAIEGLNQKLKLKKIFNETKNEYIKRLDFELKIITEMGYAGYFLIVADFIQWAKKNNIPVGPGRGSGAGSLVAWALTITDLDPIKFGLLFERFLNPERVSMPDFDIDFCMERRDEVIKYVQKKYGQDKVAQIITFGSFQARAALRDVGRVLQIPYEQVDQICKLIPFNPAKPISLKEAVESEKKIKNLIEQDLNLKKLFEISEKIEGLLRHASTHAAGVVISEKALDETLPLYRDPRSNFPVTQFSMKYVEKVGLVKFDFLGLKTLTVLKRTCELLAQKKIYIDLENISLDDQKTYDLIKSGQTIGIFQFDGTGMRDTITKIKPDRFEDLIAIVSLYRPGPMDNIPLYVKRKNSKEQINYIHPDLCAILDETYGIMVYQEQVMQIAKQLAGFSLAKADLLRRAMGKKIKSEMDAQKNNFICGCQKNNIDEVKAEQLFNEIEKFAGYGFNKSHAAAYSLVSYQTAYLKAHFPLEFLCASMEYEINNPEKLSIFCKEVKRIGFKIFKPDINYSFENFKVIYDDFANPIALRYGLGAIKNVGENSIKILVNEREKNGKFSSLVDLLKRIDNSVLNKRQLENLIFSGALVSIERNQKYLCENLEKILKFNSNHHKTTNKMQENLFEDNSLDIEYFDSKSNLSWDKMTILQKEYESLGFFLSDHPVEFFENFFSEKNLTKLSEIEDKILNQNLNFFKIFVFINNVMERKSKNGKKYVFFTFSDNTNEKEVICFSDVLERMDDTPVIGDFCVVNLEIMKNSEQSRLIVTNITKIDLNSELKKCKVDVLLDLKKLDFKKLSLILKKATKGDNRLNFYFEQNEKLFSINSKYSFSLNLNFLNDLKQITGVDKIKKIN